MAPTALCSSIIGSVAEALRVSPTGDSVAVPVELNFSPMASLRLLTCSVSWARFAHRKALAPAAPAAIAAAVKGRLRTTLRKLPEFPRDDEAPREVVERLGVDLVLAGVLLLRLVPPLLVVAIEFTP